MQQHFLSLQEDHLLDKPIIMTIRMLLSLGVIFMNGVAYCQQYNIQDAVLDRSYVLEMSYSEERGRRMSLDLKDNEGHTLDSIYYENLLWGGTARKICDDLLLVNFPLRAGSGHFLTKAIILTICEGKIYISMNLIYSEKYDFLKINPDLEDYFVEIKIEDCSTLGVSEYYDLRLLNGEETTWEETTVVRYSPIENIFFNTHTNLLNAIVEGRGEITISGTFFGIALEKFNYLYIEGQWYLHLEQNTLIPQ